MGYYIVFQIELTSVFLAAGVSINYPNLKFIGLFTDLPDFTTWHVFADSDAYCSKSTDELTANPYPHYYALVARVDKFFHY